MDKNYTKVLVQNYIKANTNSWDLKNTNNVVDLTDLCRMMTSGYDWLIRMVVATEITFDELLEWANELCGGSNNEQN